MRQTFATDKQGMDQYAVYIKRIHESQRHRAGRGRWALCAGTLQKSPPLLCVSAGTSSFIMNGLTSKSLVEPLPDSVTSNQLKVALQELHFPHENARHHGRGTLGLGLMSPGVLVLGGLHIVHLPCTHFPDQQSRRLLVKHLLHCP